MLGGAHPVRAFDKHGTIRCVPRGLVCALAALVVLAPAAQAATVRPAGSVVVRWQSNPDTCASLVLCGRSVTLSWRPGSEFLELENGTGIGYVGLFGSEAIVRSHRDSGGGR